jgi:hypothetical protein
MRPASLPYDESNRRFSWNDRDAASTNHRQPGVSTDGFIYRIKWPNDKKPRLVNRSQVIGLLAARRAGRYGGREIAFTIERSPIGDFTECAAEFAHVDGKCGDRWCECAR